MSSSLSQTAVQQQWSTRSRHLNAANGTNPSWIPLTPTLTNPMVRQLAPGDRTLAACYAAGQYALSFANRTNSRWYEDDLVSVAHLTACEIDWTIVDKPMQYIKRAVWGSLSRALDKSKRLASFSPLAATEVALRDQDHDRRSRVDVLRPRVQFAPVTITDMPAFVTLDLSSKESSPPDLGFVLNELVSDFCRCEQERLIITRRWHDVVSGHTFSHTVSSLTSEVGATHLQIAETLSDVLDRYRLHINRQRRKSG